MIQTKHGRQWTDGFCKIALSVAALIGALSGAIVLGQQRSAPGPLHFEVVSVKPLGPAANAGLGGRGGGPGLTSCSGGFAQIDTKRFALNNTNLYTLVTLAYGMGPCVFVHPEHISG